MSKKILTVSLLVSGRTDTTKKCLDSLEGILRGLDSELILVDTGCGEELRQELAGYTDQIVPFVWCDDFSKARNAGLERASGEWFLFLDDDEWFEDVAPIVEFFRSGEYQGYQQAVYKARNYSDLAGTAYTDEWVSRMIRLEPDTHFEGSVHESLVPAVGKCKKIEAFVHHYGYVFADEEAKRAHFERNVKILVRLLREEPDNLRWPLQLLQEYHSIGDGKQLRRTGQDALELIREIDRPFVNECRGAFYSAVLLGYYLEKDYEAIEDCCGEFLKDSRNTAQGQCSLCACGASAAEKRRDKEALAKYCRSYFTFLNEHQADGKDEQQQIIEESILLVKDAVAVKKQEEMRNLWAWALAGIGRPEEFPQEQQRELIALVQRLVDGNGEFLRLPAGFWDIAAGGVLPLEGILLELPLSQWMVMAMVLDAKKQPCEWRAVQEQLARIRTREDIRYDYMDMHDANVIVTSNLPEADYDYETMCRILQYFTKSNLSFAGRVYTQQAFRGEMEMLPESCRAAVWLERMLACGEQEWNKKLEYLKKSALEWHALGRTVKYFAKLIGEEQKKAAEQASAANKQLCAMAEQVKKQVRVFIGAGMNAEALSVVQQLRAMLPEDTEIAELESELKLKFS